MKVNLISDTVTQPSSEMLMHMHESEVGDDVFKEDPSVNALEDKVAALFGKEAALFFPSGTMANQTAIKLHTHPGEQVICDHYAHIFNYEGGGASFNSGVSCALINGDRGKITAEQVSEKINPADFYHSPKTALVAIENTTNKGGGACYANEEIKKIAKLCQSEQLPLHLDGARLWNAMVATSTKPVFYGQHFDTISVCFSKGLGAPVGSALVGSKEQINDALRIRKILGGGMRQAGYLAAAASYAIDNHWTSLASDHLKAKELGAALQQISAVRYLAPVETNIVIFEIANTDLEDKFMRQMSQRNIQLISMGSGKLRFVTHRDYTDDQHNYVLSSLKNLKL
ncbi:MAG: threonine aldolase family protein [Flavobacteriaceae bacterium]